MREIKFRAWNERKGWKNVDGSDCVPRMEYENFVIYPDGKKEFPQGGWDLSGKNEEMVLMQFTGMKDNLCKYIYEGDILCEGLNIVEVRYDTEKLQWSGYDKEQNYIPLYLFGKYQIIGNIYQDLELLK